MKDACIIKIENLTNIYNYENNSLDLIIYGKIISVIKDKDKTNCNNATNRHYSLSPLKLSCLRISKNNSRRNKFRLCATKLIK